MALVPPSTTIIAAGSRESHLLACDGERVVPLEGLSAAVTATALCQHRDGIALVGHSKAHMSALCFLDVAGDQQIFGRDQLPGDIQAFYALTSTEEGLFAGGSHPSGAPTVLRWDDEGWHTERLPSGLGPAVWKLGSAGGTVYALVSKRAGSQARVLVVRRDGEWHPLSPPGQVHDVWTDGELFVCVGEHDTALRFDGERWYQDRLPEDSTGLLICGTSRSDLFTLGHTGTQLFAAHFDGESWRNVATDALYRQRSLLGLTSLAPGRAVAIIAPRSIALLKPELVKPVEHRLRTSLTALMPR